MSIYCFDIDGTICETDGHDYANAKPIPWMVEAIKRLAGAGHEIRYYTARGFESANWKNARELTLQQLGIWGLPKPYRLWQKPAADIYVDDRAKLPLEFRMQFLADCLENGKRNPDAIRAGDVLVKDGEYLGLVP